MFFVLDLLGFFVYLFCLFIFFFGFRFSPKELHQQDNNKLFLFRFVCTIQHWKTFPAYVTSRRPCSVLLRSRNEVTNAQEITNSNLCHIRQFWRELKSRFQQTFLLLQFCYLFFHSWFSEKHFWISFVRHFYFIYLFYFILFFEREAILASFDTQNKPAWLFKFSEQWSATPRLWSVVSLTFYSPVDNLSSLTSRPIHKPIVPKKHQYLIGMYQLPWHECEFTKGNL